MLNSKSESYAAAGVDITAGYKAVELMKAHIARTVTSGVCSDVGGFGGRMLTLPARTLPARKKTATSATFVANMAVFEITHLFLCQPLKDFFDMPNQKTKFSLTLRCSP